MTKLSERLRDLRNGLFPDIETVNAVLDQTIAQAEAQEAQAIGEQTPVALNNDQIEQVSSWWQRRGGHDRLARAHFEAGMREVLAGGFPISTEARDRLIEAGQRMKETFGLYPGSGRDQAVIEAWDQALSALRGE